MRMDCRTSACNRIERTHTHTDSSIRCLRVNRNCESIYFVILCDKVMFYAIKWDKFIIRWMHDAPKTQNTQAEMHTIDAHKHRPLNTITVPLNGQSSAKLREPKIDSIIFGIDVIKLFGEHSILYLHAVSIGCRIQNRISSISRTLFPATRSFPSAMLIHMHTRNVRIFAHR